jgi:LPXTG-motif cell wall-anchored protein
MPTEAGTYIVTVICETAEAIYVGKDEFVIAKAVPDIGTVTADEVENDPDIAKANVRYTKTDVPGKLILTETTLTEGTNTYHWTFVPEDTNNYEIVKGTVEIKMTVPAENPPVEGEMDTPDPTTSEETTEKKSDASDEKAEHESPKTGDENILLLWVIILAAATVYLVARKRRQEAEEGGYPA